MSRVGSDHLETAAERSRKASGDYDAWIRSGEPIGHDHFIFREYLTRSGHLKGYGKGRRPPKGATFVGLLDYHKNGAGEWCGGWIGFVNVDEGRAYEPFTGGKRGQHTLVQVRPLTVTASLQCRTCGDHGFITEGRWVPA